MEKPGNRANGIRLARLLNFRPLALSIAFLALAVPLWSLSVSIDASAGEINPGEELTLTVVAYGAKAGETSLDYGSLPAGVSLVESRRESALLFPPEGRSTGATQSAVFTLILRGTLGGLWDIGPFVVTSGSEAVRYAALSLRVLGPLPGESGDESIRWAFGGSGPFRVGVPRTIALTAPESIQVLAVSCPTPENAILEPLPTGSGIVSDGTDTRLTVARFRWTPLAEGEQALPTATVSIVPDGIPLISSPETVYVLAAPLTAGRETVSPALASAFTEVPPPQGSADAAPSVDGAASVSELRRLRAAEYRALFPSTIRAERLAAELALGLDNTLPVPAAAWKPPLVLGSALALILAFSLFLFSSRIRAMKSLSLAAAIGALALAFFAVSLYIRDSRPAGVVDGGALYNVPEYGSRALETLPDGTALRRLREAGGWIYVEGVGGARGWIPATRFHGYTDTDNGSE